MSEWISVKDKLPEIKGDYIVTWQWIGSWSGQMYIEVDVCEYRGDRKWDTHREVVAWMPLPQPYKAGSEEEFIFKTIRPYCENILQREINKKQLEQILVRGALSERPRGMWVYKDHVWKCLCCGGNPHKGTGFVPSKETMKTQWKFCNLCGSEMKVMEGSE